MMKSLSQKALGSAGVGDLARKIPSSQQSSQTFVSSPRLWLSLPCAAASKRKGLSIPVRAYMEPGITFIHRSHLLGPSGFDMSLKATVEPFATSALHLPFVCPRKKSPTQYNEASFCPQKKARICPRCSELKCGRA